MWTPLSGEVLGGDIQWVKSSRHWKKKLLKKMQLNTFMEKTSNTVGIEGIRCCWVTESCQTLCDSHQAPLSVHLPRQEYWSGVPCPPPGDLPDPGIKPVSLMTPALAGGLFTISATWEAPTSTCRLLIRTQSYQVRDPLYFSIMFRLWLTMAARAYFQVRTHATVVEVRPSHFGEETI